MICSLELFPSASSWVHVFLSSIRCIHLCWMHRYEMVFNLLTLFTLQGLRLGSCLHLVVTEGIYKIMMHSAIAHYPLIDACTVPEKQLPTWATPLSFIVCFFLHTMSYSMEDPFGQFRLAVLVLSPPRYLSPVSPSLAGLYKKLKNKHPWLYAAFLSTTKHRYVTNIAFLLKPK